MKASASAVRGLMHGYVFVVAAIVSALAATAFAVFTPMPTESPAWGTAFACGLPAAGFAFLGALAWRMRPRSLAVGLWVGGLGSALVLMLPVAFALEMGLSTL